MLAQYEKPGSPASANSVKAMRREGLDLSAHRSTLLRRAELEAALALPQNAQACRHFFVRYI